MSNQPIPDPVEAAFRDLRGAVYTADGRAAMTAIEGRPDLDALQYVGDGLDHRRGRPRQWLAESGLRPTVPDAVSFGP